MQSKNKIREAVRRARLGENSIFALMILLTVLITLPLPYIVAAKKSAPRPLFFQALLLLSIFTGITLLTVELYQVMRSVRDILEIMAEAGDTGSDQFSERIGVENDKRKN